MPVASPKATIFYMSATVPVMAPVSRSDRCPDIDSRAQIEVVYVGQTSALCKSAGEDLIPLTKESRGLVPGGVTVTDRSFDAVASNLASMTSPLSFAGLLPGIDRIPRESLTLTPRPLPPNVISALRTRLAEFHTDIARSLIPHCEALGVCADPAWPILALLGAGMGATPTGDDMITGYLAACALVGDPFIDDVAPLLRASLHRTTRVSRLQIEAALDGSFAAAHHRLIDYLADDDVGSAIATARTIGHTSGIDFLTGLTTHPHIHLTKEQ